MNEKNNDNKLKTNEKLHNQRLLSLGVLASGVAHDFNNILTGMMGHISFIKRSLEKKSEKTREKTREKNQEENQEKNSKKNLDEARELLDSISSIENAILKASGLTKQILNFSKLKLNDELKVLNLTNVFKDTIFLLRASVPPIYEIETKLENDIYIKAIEASMAQILINLVVNAVDALKECQNKENLKIQIVLEKIDDKFCKFSVTDNGIGMSNKIKENILKPYFTTKGDNGTGVGLCTTFEIVKSLNGKLECASKEGKGSSFRITLPLAKDENFEKQDNQKQNNEKKKQKSGKILFVDDEEIIREVFFDGLKFLGYDVYVASGVKEAYDIFKKQRGQFDLVVSDMLMPDGSGEDLFIDLMSIRPDVKFIVISGFSSQDAVNKMLEYGAKAFLAKPFSIEELDSKIQEFL
ncbi:MAG: response regulator [Bdellovibrionota bacterium]